MTSRWLRSQLCKCWKCGNVIETDMPSGVWIDTGQCRACLIKRSASGNECAWCLDEYKIAPRANESHGICARHEQVLVGMGLTR